MNSDKKVESITVLEAANFLLKNDNFYILTHVNPDGDAMGSGFGLCRALRAVGKRRMSFAPTPFPRDIPIFTTAMSLRSSFPRL